MGFFSRILLPVLIFSLATSAWAGVIGQSDQEVKAVADPILQGVLAGFNAGNYEQYSQHFDATLKEAISPKKFKQVRSSIMKNLGEYKSRQYLGFLQRNKMTEVLWKGVFTKTEENVLIKLVLSKRQNKVYVIGLWFQ